MSEATAGLTSNNHVVYAAGLMADQRKVIKTIVSKDKWTVFTFLYKKLSSLKIDPSCKYFTVKMFSFLY
mgnify:CR=1 FL=1